MNLNAINAERALKNWFFPLMMRGLWNAPHVERKMCLDYCLPLHVDHQARAEISKAVHQQDVARPGGFPELHRERQP